ncbi:hypothetical protein ACFYWN_00435 [Streptomyces sp. NPDC002917]|uniref:hypothetical protein n=1 Tax=Streptomyces sp. NPDC002917 TaxID=3364671 RepID=UPI00369F07B3
MIASQFPLTADGSYRAVWRTLNEGSPRAWDLLVDPLAGHSAASQILYEGLAEPPTNPGDEALRVARTMRAVAPQLSRVQALVTQRWTRLRGTLDQVLDVTVKCPDCTMWALVADGTDACPRCLFCERVWATPESAAVDYAFMHTELAPVPDTPGTWEVVVIDCLRCGERALVPEAKTAAGVSRPGPTPLLLMRHRLRPPGRLRRMRQDPGQRPRPRQAPALRRLLPRAIPPRGSPMTDRETAVVGSPPTAMDHLKGWAERQPDGAGIGADVNIDVDPGTEPPVDIVREDDAFTELRAVP